MMVPYSRLRGLPVRFADGRMLGRLADIVLHRDGDAAVASRIIVARNRFVLVATRFGGTWGMTPVDADAIASIDDREVRLRESR